MKNRILYILFCLIIIIYVSWRKTLIEPMRCHPVHKAKNGDLDITNDNIGCSLGKSSQSLKSIRYATRDMASLINETMNTIGVM
jgi:hypothetical protein